MLFSYCYSQNRYSVPVLFHFCAIEANGSIADLWTQPGFISFYRQQTTYWTPVGIWICCWYLTRNLIWFFFIFSNCLFRLFNSLFFLFLGCFRYFLNQCPVSALIRHETKHHKMRGEREGRKTANSSIWVQCTIWNIIEMKKNNNNSQQKLIENDSFQFIQIGKQQERRRRRRGELFLFKNKKEELQNIILNINLV